MVSGAQAMHGAHWKSRESLPDMENFRRNGTTSGLDGLIKMDDAPSEQEFSGVLRWTYYMVKEYVGDSFFRRMYRSGVGNPPCAEHDGFRLTLSDVQAVYNAFQIYRYASPRRIVEIGPGYGALAAMLRDLYPDAHITLVDLPEHHDFLNYYVSETVGLDDIEITSELPDDTELVIAIRCMMEFPDSEIDRYFQWIQSCRSLMNFYLVNRYIKQNALRAYPFDDLWIALLSKQMFPHCDQHEFMLQRVDISNPFLGYLLDGFPPYGDASIEHYDFMPQIGVFSGVQHLHDPEIHG